MSSPTGKAVKLVNAGGLRGPVAALIERLAMFGFPPSASPEYAAAIDRECEKLISKFEDADGLPLPLGLDDVRAMGYTVKNEDGVFLGQDTFVQPLEAGAKDPCPTCGWDRALTNKDAVHECLSPEEQAWVRRGA